MLLQARKTEGKEIDITDEDIAAQAMIFFLGGFETVSTAICFTTYELALNQDVQQRLQEEIDAVWKNENGEITFEAISKMKYLDMVVSGKCLLEHILVGSPFNQICYRKLKKKSTNVVC